MSGDTKDTKVAPTDDKSAQFRVSATADESTLVYDRLVYNEETGRFEIETTEMQPNLFIAGKRGSGMARQLTNPEIKMEPNLLIIGKQDGSGKARTLACLNFIIGNYTVGMPRQLSFQDTITGSYPNGMSRGLTRWVPPSPPEEEDTDDEEMPELVDIQPQPGQNDGAQEDERKEAKPPSLD